MGSRVAAYIRRRISHAASDHARGGRSKHDQPLESELACLPSGAHAFTRLRHAPADETAQSLPVVPPHDRLCLSPPGDNRRQ